MTKTKVLAALSVAAGLAVAFSGASVAQQDAIAKRKAIMKEVGGATKMASQMIKGELPYDAKAAEAGMLKIANGWAEFAKLFPKGTETGGETTAAPTIWKDFKDFDAKGVKMSQAAATAAKEAAKGADAFKAAFPAVGGTCKGCHEVYRVKKK